MIEAPSARVIFLGGMAEVGKNLFVVETDDDILVVDFGLGFPDATLLGVDVVLPDVTWLRERRDRVRGIFITHGHEDHIGALSHLWAEVRAPVYATRLTAAMITHRMREVRLDREMDLHVFDPDAHPVLPAGGMTVEPFRVTHSIPDAVGFAITTPGGLIVHTSDFKLDPTPIDGRPTDEAALAAFAERGVRLLISDCVHIETAGATPSEQLVRESFGRIFEAAPGRIIIATFSSLLSRVQLAIEAAHEHGRRVAVLGRSMQTNVRIATDLGYLRDPHGVLIEARDARTLPDEGIVWVVTGSQGEPSAVLSRIANRDHHDIQIHEPDTVIVSATPIPGNETAVYRNIDLLFQQGANVIYPARDQVHVSGHASAAELRRVMELLLPDHVLPTHGEHRHLALYADLAREVGYDDASIHLVAPGDVVTVSAEGVAVTDRVDTGRIFIEANRSGTVDAATLDEREEIARNGLVTVVVTIDPDQGVTLGSPTLAATGMRLALEPGLQAELVAALRDAVERMLDHRDVETERIERRVKSIAATYIYRGNQRRPRIQAVVVNVSRHT